MTDGLRSDDLIMNRIRRVKCDETKPSCNRCTSTGRKCDGYSRSPSPQDAASNSVGLRTPSPHVSPINYRFIPEEELESLQFFQINTAQALAGCFDSQFWHRDIRLYADTHPSIHHGIIALGALHKRLVTGISSTVGDDISDSQILFASKHLSKSLELVAKGAKNGSQEDRITTMIAAVLFICFSSMQGYQPQAIMHLRGGLKLIKETALISQNRKEPIAPLPVSFGTLQTLFTSLDVQARGLLNDEMLATWETRPRPEALNPPTEFQSLNEARIFFEGTSNHILSFLQNLEIHPPTPDTMPFILAEHQFHGQSLAAGNAALGKFLEHQAPAPDSQERKSIAALNVFRYTATLFHDMFEWQPEFGEMAWDRCEPRARRIIYFCCQLMDLDPDVCPGPDTSSAPRPLVSFGLGVLLPLFLIAIRCRDPILRRKAIRLLHHPRREGIWESSAAARIASECMMIEENEVMRRYPNGPGINCAADVPLDCRVRDITVIYKELRRATFVIRTVEQFDQGQSGVERDLRW
jgi:hypothetical protein